ncbi:unnamed protein product [Aspergillus oryzae]|uniref:Unnamed protein product n=2 Tax=Aspergillus oryzae TaxID=5062 RepID=A0AAN5BSF8_ASPOZ|nr:unnamed protein product [Aspergillus oryzae]GMF96827.1 unnamed protein product [Aspergillus oryzae]GMG15257.1 unnamed protein product [Aspergillus oryzae]GMG30439.1 unnamed protein product [Aspergillus oryzae]GMG52839.1 unnamed protein product [Aspergillus oryzae var. brunneus]
MFLDHYKPTYLTDLKLCEHHGMIVPGSVLAADNVLYPGNPPYLEYVRSSVEQKREAAKGGPMKGYNVERTSQRQVNSHMPEGDTPAFEVIGNPNLVYQSVLQQPEGEWVSLRVEDGIVQICPLLITVIGCHRSHPMCGVGGAGIGLVH